MKYSAHCVDGTVCAVHVQRGVCGLWVTALKEVADDSDPAMQCSANACRAQTLLPTTVYILYICPVYRETKPPSMLFCFIKSVRHTWWRCCLKSLAIGLSIYFVRQPLVFQLVQVLFSRFGQKGFISFCAFLCINQGLWLSALYWLPSEEVLSN